PAREELGVPCSRPACVTGGEDGGSRVPVLLCPPPSRPPGGAPRFPLRTVPGPARRPAFLFQPQRFGREVRTGQGPRAGHRAGPHFWSLAVPQRFGKK
uniref:Neuropeptide FF-amide peptide precursor n=1 Tax=Ornithorhynchus anatinus TaxID=9258 RepID=A0A6I8N586_ORNAN